MKFGVIRKNLLAKGTCKKEIWKARQTRCTINKKTRVGNRFFREGCNFIDVALSSLIPDIPGKRDERRRWTKTLENLAMHMKWETMGSLQPSLGRSEVTMKRAEGEGYLTGEIPSSVHHYWPVPLPRAFNLTTFSLAELSHRELRTEVNEMDRWSIPSLSDFANFRRTCTYFGV